MTEGVGSSLNGATGIVGNVAGSGDSTVGGLAGTAEKTVPGTTGGGVLAGGLLGARQLGNIDSALGGLSRSTSLHIQPSFRSLLTDLDPNGLLGALGNLGNLVSTGGLSHEDLTNLPQAIQDVIGHLHI